MVQVIVTAPARKQIAELPNAVISRLDRVIEELEHWPSVSGAKPLRGDMKGMYRKRTGDYRIVFRVVGQTLYVEKVGHRKDVYE